jgi:PAS domain S-box-containing protein
VSNIQNSYDYVIVGAGVAGARAVEGVRELDADASVALIGAEKVPPLYRPDLSKAMWLEGDRKLADSYLLTDDVAVDMQLDTQVSSIDPDAHTVTLADGATVGYGKLLLATGSQPRMAGVTPGPRVMGFREAADYETLRAVATPGSHIVIVGGGYIGAELTSALVQNDVNVTLVMVEDLVQQHMFPRELAERVTAEFVDRGVEVIHGFFSSVEPDDAGATVIMKDGRQVRGDAVVLGIGVAPRTELAEAAGLEVDNGILVDDHLRTSAADIYAVGDVASFPEPLLGRRRIEHMDNAETMGKAVGRIMAGEDVAYGHTPFFWSDLFDDGYEAVGLLNSKLQTVVDWNSDESAAVVYYVDEGRVVGVLLWNTWASVPKALDLIAETKDAPVADVESLRGRIEVPEPEGDAPGDDAPASEGVLDIDAFKVAALDDAGDGIIVIDRQGIIRVWNAHCEKLFGWTADQVIGQDVKIMIPEYLRAAHDRGFFAAMESGHLRSDGSARRTKALTPTGGKVYVEMTFAVVKGGSDQAIGAVAVARHWDREKNA